jgi:RNA polymerase sigma-70 factor (ECF subfamily)
MDLAEQFTANRPMLFALVYRMLGSVADTEDVLQDAWLRWSSTDRSEVADPRAYLARTVTRVALNHLRSRRSRREVYVGPWLPEPLVTGADAAEKVLTDESVSVALLVVLESLSPLERVAFVMYEVFGFSHDEVGEALGRSPAAVRQLTHRAREHVRARRPRFDTDRNAQREATERFLRASAGGDLDRLLELLAPDVVLWADGGGAVKAPPRPLVGALNVARFWLAIAPGLADHDVRIVELNGQPAAVSTQGGEPTGALSLDLADGLVRQIRIVVNPNKLRALTVLAAKS